MRALAYLLLALLFNLYGLTFDLVLAGDIGSLLCNFWSTGACPISQSTDHRLTALILLMVLPAICLYIANWLSHGLRFARYSALLGLLLVTP